ncbi:DUF5667 domain-containing protein [Actinokineospora sp. HUAS TT18]|uniref:DUF5667 domain-containing protein n=1 Tax=Actinokineospora sp. HUAS TT18 TaxID=3447451 RepID=UPI003F520BA8
MVDSGSGPHGRREHSARAARSRPDLPGFTADDEAVVELLAGLSPLTAPSGDARDRMRARILAGIAEPAVEGPRATRPPRAGRAPRGRRSESAPKTRPEPARTGSGARGRFAVAAVAVLALVFSLAGMSLLLSRDALPGDALYAIKRTGEAASLGLTFGDEGKAYKHLQFATARVTEIETLTQRYPNTKDAPIGGYLSALNDFDGDAAAGSRQLIGLATAGDGSQLEALRLWADHQGARLAALGPKLPGAAGIHQAASVALLDKIEERAAALTKRMQCVDITSGSIDEVGAQPATGTCDPRPGAVTQQLPNPQPNTGPAKVPTVTTAVPPSPVQPGQSGTQDPGVSVLTTTPPLISVPPIVGGPSTSPSPSGSTSPAAPAVTVPLPLLPTIALPPLLPGLPGIVIG